MLYLALTLIIVEYYLNTAKLDKFMILGNEKSNVHDRCNKAAIYHIVLILKL